jgi:hypothetical protein
MTICYARPSAQEVRRTKDIALPLAFSLPAKSRSGGAGTSTLCLWPLARRRPGKPRCRRDHGQFHRQTGCVSKYSTLTPIIPFDSDPNYPNYLPAVTLAHNSRHRRARGRPRRRGHPHLCTRRQWTPRLWRKMWSVLRLGVGERRPLSRSNDSTPSWSSKWRSSLLAAGLSSGTSTSCVHSLAPDRKIYCFNPFFRAWPRDKSGPQEISIHRRWRTTHEEHECAAGHPSPKGSRANLFYIRQREFDLPESISIANHIIGKHELKPSGICDKNGCERTQ